MNQMTKEEWFKLGNKLYGDDILKWKFKCPSCGHIQTPEDFRPYKERGATPDSARFCCIGRFDGHGDVVMGTRPGPCNYTSGGLLNINPLSIVDGEREITSFEFAD